MVETLDTIADRHSGIEAAAKYYLWRALGNVSCKHAIGQLTRRCIAYF